MSDDENGLAGIASVSKQVDHVGGGVNVNVGEGLVEQQDFGIVKERACQRHPLPHALRVLPDRTREIRIEPDGVNRFRTARAVINSVELGKVFQILPSAHFVVKERRMSHVADLVADIVKVESAEDRDLAASGPAKSSERAEQRSLAGAIVTEDAVELPTRELGGHTTQRGEAAELLDQVGNRDDRRSFSHRV